MTEAIIPPREALVQWEREEPLFHALEMDAAIHMVYASDEVRSAMFDGPVRRFGISRGKFGVLLVLYHRRKALAPSDLARLTGMTRASISKMLIQLKAEALIQETIANEDGRQRRVELTEEGRQEIRKMLPLHYQRVYRLMSRLSDEEKRTLIDILKKLNP